MIDTGYTDWKYNGDRNLEYGGYFYRHYMLNGFPQYSEIVNVTNLESATGAGGLTLIEFLTTFNHGDKKRVKSALSCIDISIADLRKLGKEVIINLITEAYLAEGYYDPDSDYFVRPDRFVVVNSNYGYASDKRKWDGWRPDKFGKEATVTLHKQYGGDLEAYIRGEWLQ